MIDLFGKEVEVLGYPDSSLIGLKGKVVLETKKTLIIQTVRGKKVRVMKVHLVLGYDKGIVYGEKLVGDLAYRIKKGR